MTKPAGFYLGKAFDPATDKLGAEVRLDPADLTTHAVVIGMTGSGKTGLCIDLLEEAALAGIPALAIDPKGDLGNLLLTFPELRAQDFAPWLPPGEAERKGLSADEHAAQVAASWRAGLAEWGLDGERIHRLLKSAEITLYSPGSRAGVPVDILASFTPPDLAWESDEEALRESIRFSVTALLALLGIEADPLQSRELIFLSHLVESAWRAGAPCDVASLIRGLQQPPFQQLGVFEVESFYPTRERMKLAIALNGVLAAPGFAPWMEGEPLDPTTLLLTPEGKPRIAIFHLGHLAEREKLFFTTLLLAATNVWMRRQGGTTQLRALAYIDEVLGMIPPYPANPPTKEILLLLMKQARAFGLGMVLTTQNPVDVDYKVLTNAGTWFIGRLQTQQDKDRVLEGLVGQGGMAGASRSELDARIGGLPQRSFLLYSARGGAPQTFKSRWALSYLRGPLTREEVARLKPKPATAERVGPSAQAPTAEAAARQTRPTVESAAENLPTAPAAAPKRADAAPTKPPAAGPPKLSGAGSTFLTPEGLAGLGPTDPAPSFVGADCRFLPGLYAAGTLRYDESRAGLNVTERVERLIFPIPAEGSPSWDASRAVELGPAGTAPAPPRSGAFEPLPASLLEKAALGSLRKAFTDHLLANATLETYLAPELRIYSRHDESRADFEARLARDLRARRDAEVAKLRTKYATKLAALQRKLEKERADVAASEQAYGGRKREEMASGAESVFGFILGRKGTRAISQASRQRRMTETARLKAERERGEEAGVRSDLEALNAELETEVRTIEERYTGGLPQVQTLEVPLERDDVTVETFAILWVPVA